jgi:hypothetical protein
MPGIFSRSTPAHDSVLIGLQARTEGQPNFRLHPRTYRRASQTGSLLPPAEIYFEAERSSIACAKLPFWWMFMFSTPLVVQCPANCREP